MRRLSVPGPAFVLAALLMGPLAFSSPSVAAPALSTALTGSAVEIPPGRHSMPTADEFAHEFDDEFGAEPACYEDPLEGFNRRTLAFNQEVDHWLLNPIGKVYRFILPSQARRSVRQALANVNTPVILANDLLQREWADAGVTVTRFGINSTLGVAGLFDPAESFGFARHTSDFGQTMALEGVPAGAYIVLPLLGPTTVRDGIGGVIDMLFRPTTYVLGPVDQIFYTTIYGGSYGLAEYSAVSEQVAALEASSVDYYAALRSAFYQSRTAEIWDGREDHDSLASLASEWGESPADWDILAFWTSRPTDGSVTPVRGG